ncbi:MAG: exosortase K [Acidobacteriota bacterium]
MNKKLHWTRIAQWAVVLLVAFTLKLFYSKASANELQWILAPTTSLVELTSGTRFEFESYTGYVSQDRRFVIAPACAGVNFLIAAFLMLSTRKLLKARQPAALQARQPAAAWKFLPAAALIAYLVTLIANTARIAIALHLEQLSDVSGLSANQLHRIEGITVYFVFLFLLFIVNEKISAGKFSGGWRRFCYPILAYYTIVFLIPLINGGYNRGAAFWEYSLLVLVIPLLVILPLIIFYGLGKRVEVDANSNVQV